MRRLTAACLLLCLFASFVLIAACTSSSPPARETAKSDTASTSAQGTPITTPESAQPLKPKTAVLPEIA